MHRPLTRSTLTILLTVSFLLPLATTSPVATAQDKPHVVRTLVYRDLMPSTGTEIIENFVSGGSPVLSADGSAAVYSITRPDGSQNAPVAHVYLFDIESRTSTEVDTTSPGPMLDISDDGSTALTLHQPQAGGPRLVRVADASGARTVVENAEVYITEAVLSGDGKTVVFVLSRDSPLVGVDNATGGIWAVNADGSDLRQLVSAEDVRSLMKAKSDDLILFGGYPMQVDVSSDGNRIVFDAVNYRTGEWFAFTYTGGKPSVLHGPASLITRLAISGDGSTVLSLVTPYPGGTGPGEFIVSGFDGSGRRTLATNDKVGDWYDKGTMLSEDGSLALLGGSGLLYDTATGDAITLAIGCAALSGGELPRLTMDGTGTRFLYLANDYHSPAPLSLLEVDPVKIPDGVPKISNVSVDPPVVKAGDQTSTATVSARIAADGEPANCVLVLNGTRNESRIGVSVSGEALYDGGTVGDKTAGDGVYANNTLHASEGMVSGSRTVRIKAEVQDAEGYRSAMAVDVEPFSVNGVAPPEASPSAANEPGARPVATGE